MTQPSDTARRVFRELHARFDTDTLTGLTMLLISWRATLNQIANSQTVETRAYTSDAATCSACPADIPAKDPGALHVRYQRQLGSRLREYEALLCGRCKHDFYDLAI